MNTDHYAVRQRLIVGLAYVLHLLLIPAVVGAVINVLKIREYDKPVSVDNSASRGANSRVATLASQRWMALTQASSSPVPPLRVRMPCKKRKRTVPEPSAGR